MTTAVARKKPGQAAMPAAVIPFTAAAHEHVEPAFDTSVTPTTSAQQLGPFDVPAYGYLRHIYILVTTSGGTIGSATLAADAPWNVFQEVTLLDVNGGQMFGPFTGYQTFLANKWGSYAFTTDPALAPDANVSGAITFSFGFRIPVEILHNNGLGALANQNAAAAYKVRLVVNTIANIWGVAPTTAPAVRVRGYLEAWSQPTQSDAFGRMQATVPPAHGTSQFWTVFNKAIVAGDNVILLPRVGNLLRNLIVVLRDGSGVRRTFANMPDPIDVRWDARQLINEPLIYRRQVMRERVTTATGGTGGVEDGVLAYQFTHDVLGHAGDGTAELFLPTVQATRLEVHASNFTVGTIEILTNDVAPVEVRPADRYEEQSRTGFQPAGVGAYGRNGQ